MSGSLAVSTTAPFQTIISGIGFFSCTVLLASCVDHVPYYSLDKFLPACILLAVYSSIMFQGFQFISLMPDCSSACQDVVFLSITVLDWISSCAVDLCFFLRLRACLTGMSVTFRRLNWLLLIPICLYGAGDFLFFCAYGNLVSMSFASEVYLICSIGELVNETIMHTLIIWCMEKGPLSHQLKGSTSKRRLMSVLLLIETLIFLGANVYFQFNSSLGIALISVAWGLNVKIFVLINNYIRREFATETDLSSIRQTGTKNHSLKLNKLEGTVTSARSGDMATKH